MIPMFTALAQALAAGLSIWDSKEKTKYLDKLMRVQKDYHEEFNKDPASRSDAVLDNLEFELRLVAIAFASGVRESNAAPKP